MTNPCDNCGADLRVCKDCEIYNDYIAIPKDATNGDMIKAMFPDVSVTEIGGGSTMAEWADYYNIPYNLFFRRYQRGWNFERIITTPKQEKKKHGTN